MTDVRYVVLDTDSEERCFHLQKKKKKKKKNLLKNNVFHCFNCIIVTYLIDYNIQRRCSDDSDFSRDYYQIIF